MTGSSHEQLVAARTRAEIGIADVLMKHYRIDDHTAGRAAENILSRLEADGWHHTAAHTAPPPSGPPAPSDSETARQALAAMRAELDEIHARHKAEDAAKENQ